MSQPTDSASRKLKYVDPASFTPHFAWEKSAARGGTGEEVVCERVRLDSVAQKFGTPTYLYSRAAIDDAYEELHRGLGAVPHTLCFAVKSNANLSILNHLAKRRNDFTLRTVIRSGSAGRESARISARRLQRSFHFAALCGGWLDLSESCGARRSICGIWMLGAGLECGIRIRCRRHEWSTRGWFHRWCANLACTCCWSQGVRSSLRRGFS